MKMIKSTLFCLLIHLSWSADVYGKEKVKLTDISTLTLHKGRWTTSRRTQPVPQLQCVGGSASSSSSLLPSTVQCYNKGHDGQDVQWECKANLAEGTKFGSLDVICEGYDYPDDPYVLKGSCGLEYMLEKGSGQSRSQYQSQSESKTSSYRMQGGTGGLGDLVILAIVLIVAYALYKTCLANNQTSPTEGDYPGGTPYPQGYQGGFPSAPPPPSSYTYPDHGSGCSGDRNYYSRSTRRGGTGSFWTGAATGGILGYLFGSRGSSGSTRPRNEYQPPDSSSTGGSYTNTTSGASTGESSTYTASGFGGTRRR